MSYDTIPEMFASACKRGADRTALRRKVHGRWESISWRRWEESSRAIGKGLLQLGMARGDRVAILSSTRLEWVFADLGIICAGGVTVPLYQSNLAREVEYILADSASIVVFVEDEKQLEKVVECRSRLPNLEKIVLIAGYKPDDPQVIRLDDLIDLGKQASEAALSERMAEATGDDLATIVYTSGTTGPPKGAMLTQKGILFVAESTSGVIKRTAEDETLLFLPLAHIFARIVEFVCIHDTIVLSFAESIEKLLDNLAEIKPTFMGSVPRIYEKVYAKVIGDMEEAGGAKKRIFDFALSVGRDVSRRRQKRESVPPLVKAQHMLADRLVFSKLRARFGGRLLFFVSGGAPLSKEIAEFFHAAGILILEGYGLTETTAVTNINRPESYRFGTVGQPIPGVEQKIAADGEVLSRSPGVMRGYYNRPEDTRDVLDEDGWLYTGDIGEFDAEGFLRITDRKKDIIVTAGGKNIAPQNIENHIKTNSFISQAMVYGDKRKYCTALITLNYEEAAKWATTQGISFEDEKDLATHPVVLRKVEQIIDLKNRDLASYESIKRIAIIPDDFTQESGELTPTLKVKRKVVSQKYKDIIDSLYEDKTFE